MQVIKRQLKAAGVPETQSRFELFGPAAALERGATKSRTLLYIEEVSATKRRILLYIRGMWLLRPRQGGTNKGWGAYFAALTCAHLSFEAGGEHHLAVKYVHMAAAGLSCPASTMIIASDQAVVPLQSGPWY
jgi:hypothetical protein